LLELPEVAPHKKKNALYAIYAMSFLTSVGFGAYGIVVSLYMWSLGISFSGLGLAFSMFGISMAAAGTLFGAHSDVVGRKRYLVLSLFMTSATMFLYTQARGLAHFMVLEGLGGISASLRSVIASALITDLTREKERGGKFGGMGGFSWIGTGLGYLAGGLFSGLMSFFWVFVVISLLDIVSCLLVIFFVTPYRVAKKESFRLISLKGLTSQMRVWLAVSFVSALASVPVEVIVIPVYIVEFLGVDRAVFGVFMASSYMALSLTQFLGGNMADKHDRGLIFSVSQVASAFFIALQPMFPFFPCFATLYFLEGLAEGLSMPSRNALSASSVRPEHRGLDFSLLNLAGNVGSVVGSLGIGMLLETVSFDYSFYIRALTYLVVALLVYLGLK